MATPAQVDVASNGIWGTGPKDVWVGTWHFDGSEWKEAPSDPHVAIQLIWGRSSNDVWTVSMMGEVLHYDGTRWSLATVLQYPTGITGSETDLLLVGRGGMILRKKL